MARQKGIIPLEGTLGGINFYNRLGKSVARAAGGGFNSKSSKKNPIIADWNSEMGAASTANARFRQVFRSFVTGYKDGTWPARIQSLFMKIKDLDTVSVRGQRTVAKGMAHPYAKRLLKDFNFTLKRAVLLNGQLDFDWATYTLTVSQFDIRDAGIPKGADLMGLQLMSVRFDFDTFDFVKEESAFLELYPDFGDTEIILQTDALPDGTGVRLVFLRVAYYQKVNGVNYLLPGDGRFGLEILGVADS